MLYDVIIKPISYFYNGTEILIIKKDNDGKSFVAKPVDFKWEEIKDGDVYPEGTLKFDGNEATLFFDKMFQALIERGYTTEISKGEIKQLENFKKDLKDIIFAMISKKEN